MRHDLFVKTMSLSGHQTDTFHIPSLISRMTSDTYNIHQMVGMMQRLGVRAPMILIGGIIITSTMESVLTLVLIVLLPILGGLIFYISKKGIPLYKKVQGAMDSMVRIMRENITGIRVIKALSRTEYEKQRFSEANDEMRLLLNIGLTVVVVVGAYRVNSGASEPGKIVAFLSYFTMILNAVIMINRIFMVLSKATASAGRVEEVLAAPEELLQQKAETLYGGTREVPHIEFRNVSFGYHALVGETEKYCIRNLSFSVKKGESLGIIGATGSGKTTLLNLLMRFYDVTEGKILVDGRDIKEMRVFGRHIRWYCRKPGCLKERYTKI